MSLIVRLGCIGALTAGGCVPLALEMFNESKDKWGDFVFESASAGGGKSRQPILTCKGEQFTIQVFLAWKSEEINTEDKKVYLKGYLRGKGTRQAQEINFEEQELGKAAWNLIIYRSGTTRLIKARDWHGEDNYCESVFKVTKFKYGNGSDRNDSWEDPITKVQLTLSECKTVNRVKKCDIKIQEGVGLTWIPTFAPKAFFK